MDKSRGLREKKFHTNCSSMLFRRAGSPSMCVVAGCEKTGEHKPLLGVEQRKSSQRAPLFQIAQICMRILPPCFFCSFHLLILKRL